MRRSRSPSIRHLERSTDDRAGAYGAVCPSDREHERLRDARHLVQSVGRQPDDLGHLHPGRAQPAGDCRRSRPTTTKSAPRPRCSNGQLLLQTAAFNTVKTNLRVTESAQQMVTVTRRHRDGARLGSERGRQAHRRLAADHELRLHARPHHQDGDTDPAQCRADEYADPRILDVDDLRHHQAAPGRRRRLLQQRGLGRPADDGHRWPIPRWCRPGGGSTRWRPTSSRRRSRCSSTSTI